MPDRTIQSAGLLARAGRRSGRREPYGAPTILGSGPRHRAKKTVGQLILDRLEPTLALATSTILLAVGLAVPLGVTAAYRQPHLDRRVRQANIMAEGRTLFRVVPHNILFPGVFLAVTVLAVNMLGDGLRDTLDPRIHKWL